MFKRKSIVLSDLEEKSNKKAVLTLVEDDIGVKGTIRLYNFASELAGISSLGFYIDSKVYKAGLTYKSFMLYEFFINIKEIPTKFSCAVINFQNAVATPILYGSSDGNNDEIYSNIISELSQNKTMKNVENVLDKYGVEYDEEEQQEIEREIDKSINEGCENCQNCIYKKCFFENQSKKAENQIFAEATKQELEEKNEEQNQNSEAFFIDKLKPQIDKLFQINPAEENLQKLIPSSKWVKVEYEDDGDFYVFGLLYDDSNNVKYVCYGVPAVFEEEAPKELSGYPIWLPLDKDKQDGFGYWMTYQDATTGEPVKAVID